MTTIEEWPKEFNDLPENPKSCKNCRHFCPYIYEMDTDDSSDSLATDYGECRRYPPKVVPAEESAFPVVEENCWCGEFDI